MFEVSLFSRDYGMCCVCVYVFVCVYVCDMCKSVWCVRVHLNYLFISVL